jgi:modulator of FtsH protease
MENQANNPFAGAVAPSEASALATNKVLRNTYMLLAISMVPTVLGAWLGVTFKLPIPGGFIGFILLFAGVMGFQFAIHKFRDSSAGVVIMLAFTFFMGLILSRLLGQVIGFKNGMQLIMMAFGGTALVLTGMSMVGMAIKKPLTGLGKFLFVGMWIALALAAFAIIFQIPALMLALIGVSLIIFSLYIMYDVNKIVTGGETNYIWAATQLYISVFSVFQNLLALLGIFGGEKD